MNHEPKIVFEAHMPGELPSTRQRSHPQSSRQAGGITQYCPSCDEHVRMLFGLVPVRLKRCPCGAFSQFNRQGQSDLRLLGVQANDIWWRGIDLAERAEDFSTEHVTKTFRGSRSSSTDSADTD